MEKLFTSKPKAQNEPETDKKLLEKRKPEDGQHKKKSKRKKKKKYVRHEDKLKSSQFRLLNEFLYTNDSAICEEYFTKRESDFKVYHEGFASQIEKWPFKPIEIIFEYLESNFESLEATSLIDLGCGEGKLETMLTDKKLFRSIFSYDLVSCKPHVIAKDIKNLDHEDDSIDIAVFCLSLMGLNWIEFIAEAVRLVRLQGHILISEVTSRFTSVPAFTLLLRQLGLKRVYIQQIGTHFNFMVFKKVEKTQDPKTAVLDISSIKKKSDFEKELKDLTLVKASKKLLKPCIYKRR